jgi:hypothetical protein
MDANVTALLVDALHDTMGDMVWGSNYGQVLGLFGKEDENGKAVAVSIDVNFGGGQGGNYSQAKTNSSLVKRVQFLVPFYKGYGISTVPLDDNNLTKGPASAAVLLVDESQKAINAAKNGLDVLLSSDGYGTRGLIVVATNTAGSTWTCTFATGSETRRFWPGMVLTQKDTPSGTLQAGTGTVTAVQTQLKKITLTAAGGFTPANGYALGQQGDQATGSTFTTYPGLKVWFPPAASRPAAALYGVTRTENEQKLAGSYLDGTNMSVLEGILQLEAQIANVPGAKPNTLLMSTTTKAKVMSDCQTQKRYVETREVQGSDINVFFKVISIQGVSGMLDIVESSNWDDNLVAILDRDDLKIAAPGKMPIRPINSNGSPIVEDPEQDACIIRFRSQAAVFPRNPGFHGMLTVRA